MVKVFYFLPFSSKLFIEFIARKKKIDKHKTEFGFKTQNFKLVSTHRKNYEFKNLFSCRTNKGWSSTWTNVLKRTLKGIIINRVNKEEIIFATRILLYPCSEQIFSYVVNKRLRVWGTRWVFKVENVLSRLLFFYLLCCTSMCCSSTYKRAHY